MRRRGRRCLSRRRSSSTRSGYERDSSTTSFARGSRPACARSCCSALASTHAGSACRRSRRARPACTRSTSPSSWRRSARTSRPAASGCLRGSRPWRATSWRPGLTIRCTSRSGRGGFRRGERALFVWEGVTPYIDTAAVDRSLRFVVNAGGRGSRLAFDFAAGITFDPEPPAERLRGTGFTAFEAAGFDELWRLYRQPGEPHPNASIMQMGVAEV